MKVHYENYGAKKYLYFDYHLSWSDFNTFKFSYHLIEYLILKKTPNRYTLFSKNIPNYLKVKKQNILSIKGKSKAEITQEESLSIFYFRSRRHQEEALFTRRVFEQIFWKIQDSWHFVCKSLRIRKIRGIFLSFLLLGLDWLPTYLHGKNIFHKK